MIEVKHLSKKYGRNWAVNDVSFKIEKGEIVGFLGPNGAGKSTIMNILTGYISSTAGEVSVDGYDILEESEAAKRRIGYLPEIPPLYTDMTVAEYLYFIYDLKKVTFPKKAHIDEIMELVKIKDVSERLIKNLSKGYRQRTGIAAALVGNPDVLILDEPTVGLDPKQIIEIRNLIVRLGKNHTVILSSHILSEIQAVCKRIIIINKGKLVANDTAENLSKNLSSDHSLVVRVLGPESEVIKILKGIKNIESVIPQGLKEENAYEYLVSPVAGCDVRGEIFKRLAERNRPMLKLASNELTLEQIFLSITDGTSKVLLNTETDKTVNPEDIVTDIPTAEDLKEDNE